MLIARVDSAGAVTSQINYNFQTAGISFKVATNTLEIVNNKLVFGSFTRGFTTRYNSYKVNRFSSHLFYLDESLSNNCFYTNTIVDRTTSSAVI
jgi:hypothetical protein